AYTWSKSLATASDFLGGIHGIQDRYNRKAERGFSDTDTPQRLVTSFSYELPVGRGRGFANSGIVGKLLERWQVNGIVTYQNGQPIGIGIPFDTSGTGNGSRPNCIAPPAIHQTIDHWLDPNAYAIPEQFFFGNCDPTPGPRTPGLSTWDTSLFKQISVTETKRFEFRAEFFNTWNTP